MTEDAVPPPGDLQDVADRLYALLPDDFTAERGAEARRARATGNRALAEAVGRLRKPSAAAWLVNALVRRRRDEVEGLLALGEQLRQAQVSLEGEALRELGRQRHQLLAAIGRQARALARELGRPVSEAVAEDVQQTFSAALADPAAADAVRAGTLTSALRYAGLGEVDLDGAVAVPRRPATATDPATDPAAGPDAGPAAGPEGAAPVAPAPAVSLDEARGRRQAEQAQERRRRRLEQALEEAEHDVQEAGESLARAEEELRTAGQRRAEASRRQVAVKRRIEDLQARLHAAEAEAVAATHELRRLEHDHQAAERAAALARRMTDRARARRERTLAELTETADSGA